jgi:hypothetical protein
VPSTLQLIVPEGVPDPEEAATVAVKVTVVPEVSVVVEAVTVVVVETSEVVEVVGNALANS